MASYFISDLHLSRERPAINQLFLNFLQEHAPQADAVYILGDLFEVWLGDDMILPEYQPAIEAIASTVKNGTPVYVMYGNRDFLMKEKFEELSGAKLIHEPYVIDLYGKPTLLLHGDSLCTDDVEYQKFKAMVRNPKWQAQVLAKSPEERLALAKQLRETSKSETASKAEDIMDVNQQTVEQTMQDNHVLHLIHGHTHRPATHEFTIDDNKATRIVLADWYETGSFLSVDESGYQTHELKL